MNKILASVSLVCLLFACSSKNENSLSITEQIIDIPISVEQLNYYYHWYINQEENIFVGYNHTMHTLDFFDLTQMVYKKTTQLAYEGPNGIQQGMSKFVYFQDTIVVDQGSNILLLSAAGEIIERIRLEDILTNEQASYLFQAGLHTSNYDELIYNPTDKTILKPVFGSLAKTQKGFYESPMLAKIFIEDKRMEVLEVGYPKIFRGNDFYGNLDYPRVFQKEDSLIYNFANSSNIYYFNLSTKEEGIFDAPSQFISNLSPTISVQEYAQSAFKHEWNSNSFYAIRYDPFQNLYYRIHKGKTDTESLFDYSNNYFMIMNSQFEVLSEFKLDPRYIPIFAVTKEGIYFPMKEDDEKGESVMSLALIKPARI